MTLIDPPGRRRHARSRGSIPDLLFCCRQPPLSAHVSGLLWVQSWVIRFKVQQLQLSKLQPKGCGRSDAGKSDMFRRVPNIEPFLHVRGGVPGTHIHKYGDFARAYASENQTSAVMKRTAGVKRAFTDQG